METTRHARRAFTLLEVVVAMVIVLVGMILFIPALLELRSNAGDITCQNNLRQLLVALSSYNLDYNGSMPYGVYYVGSGPPTWQPPPGVSDFVGWISELNRYFNVPGYSPAFQCPQAQKQVAPHPVSYVMNFIVAVSPIYEVLIGGTPPRAQTKPPSVHLMMQQGTALIWDTAVQSNWADDPGFVVGADLDYFRVWYGAIHPQHRYFLPHDPFGAIPPGTYGNNQPVLLGPSFRNIDPPPNSNSPYQGNLRFRHDNQTKCNVAFSDGSVRQFTATTDSSQFVTAHDAIRRYFMIHWPPGVTPDPALPH